METEVTMNFAKKCKELIDPRKNIEAKRFLVYQREPYVLCGDVYDASGFRGRGGWSWYTGAAGWYYRLFQALEELEKDKNIKSNGFCLQVDIDKNISFCKKQ